MENEGGGYKIRSASDQYKFKSALIKRDITVIRGRGVERKSVSVFEGMTDFLSLLVLQKKGLAGERCHHHALPFIVSPDGGKNTRGGLRPDQHVY